MGKIIDRAALWAGGATLCYLLFLGAWQSIPLACAAAFVAVALARALADRVPLPRRAGVARARAELLRLAGLEDREAGAALEALLRRRYPGEDFRLTPVLKHPEASLTLGDLLNAWKANRDAARLVVASTCPCEPRAALFARQLRDPAVAVVDSRKLLRLLRACDPGELPTPPRVSPRQRLRRLADRVACARVTPRTALLAAMLLASYLFGGNPWCLAGALALVLHMGLALSRRRVGRRLFEP